MRKQFWFQKQQKLNFQSKVKSQNGIPSPRTSKELLKDMIASFNRPVLRPSFLWGNQIKRNKELPLTRMELLSSSFSTSECFVFSSLTTKFCCFCSLGYRHTHTHTYTIHRDASRTKLQRPITEFVVIVRTRH